MLEKKGVSCICATRYIFQGIAMETLNDDKIRLFYFIKITSTFILETLFIGEWVRNKITKRFFPVSCLCGLISVGMRNQKI